MQGEPSALNLTAARAVADRNVLARLVEDLLGWMRADAKSADRLYADLIAADVARRDQAQQTQRVREEAVAAALEAAGVPVDRTRPPTVEEQRAERDRAYVKLYDTTDGQEAAA